MKVKNKGIFFKILIKQIKQFEISVENIWRKFELKNQKKKKKYVCLTLFTFGGKTYVTLKFVGKGGKRDGKRKTRTKNKISHVSEQNEKEMQTN